MSTYADQQHWILIFALELTAVEGQSLLQAIQGGEFCVTEALWLHLQFIFNNSHVGAFATSKEVGDISDCGVEGKVAKVDRERGLVGQRKFLTDRVTCKIESV